MFLDYHDCAYYDSSKTTTTNTNNWRSTQCSDSTNNYFLVCQIRIRGKLSVWSLGWYVDLFYFLSEIFTFYNCSLVYIFDKKYDRCSFYINNVLLSNFHAKSIEV